MTLAASRTDADCAMVTTSAVRYVRTEAAPPWNVAPVLSMVVMSNLLLCVQPRSVASKPAVTFVP